MLFSIKNMLGRNSFNLYVWFIVTPENRKVIVLKEKKNAKKVEEEVIYRQFLKTKGKKVFVPANRNKL